ncbi:RNA-binding protein 34 [Polymixia lowei]
MKKKLHQKGEERVTGQQSGDYVVGQVSGSLFPKDPGSSGSLSALFSAAPAAGPLVFRPASKPVQKSSEVKEQKVTPLVKGPARQNQRKPPKEKSVADRKVQNRESALQNADEEEQEQKQPKKRKRKVVDVGGGAGVKEEEEVRPMKRQKTAASIEEEQNKDKRTVFVGNLPASCTKKTLQMLFRGTGTIESVRFRSVVREDPSMSLKVAMIQRKVHPKKSNINAYVVFKDEQGVMNALQRNGTEIEKNVFIRVDRVTESSSHDHKRSIFVGNLEFEIKELALRQHFEECGNVENVRLVRDKDSGMGKGFGYILFESADSVQLALKLDGSKLEGRYIRVKRSVNKEKEMKTGKGPTKGPTRTEGRGNRNKGTVKEKGPTMGGLKGSPGLRAQRKYTGKRPQRSPGKPQGTSSFKGEMADPSKKMKKKKGMKKKKQKPGKTVHI